MHPYLEKTPALSSSVPARDDRANPSCLSDEKRKKRRNILFRLTSGPVASTGAEQPTSILAPARRTLSRGDREGSFRHAWNRGYRVTIHGARTERGKEQTTRDVSIQRRLEAEPPAQR
ncbi:hypothetical protein K0M31_020036 [Melipona bicolor]|uniref:Uncharacterized protein n=1 Tax=Melipona bicolor TaxID=60889 RepID=A0AA40G1Q5_9HYME|nr:hypothetical protein K0M31_020036 [Melipona bicolor]